MMSDIREICFKHVNAVSSRTNVVPKSMDTTIVLYLIVFIWQSYRLVNQ